MQGSGNQPMGIDTSHDMPSAMDALRGESTTLGRSSSPTTVRRSSNPNAFEYSMSACSETHYSHATGELVVAPTEELAINRFQVTPREALVLVDAIRVSPETTG